MAAEVRKIYIFISEQNGEFVARSPQLELYAAEDTPEAAFETFSDLVQEHLQFAEDNGFTWEQISTPVPSAIEAFFARAEEMKRPSASATRFKSLRSAFELDPFVPMRRAAAF